MKQAEQKNFLIPVTSTYTGRGGRAEDYFILPLCFSTEYVRMTVKKYSIAKKYDGWTISAIGFKDKLLDVWKQNVLIATSWSQNKKKLIKK